MNKKQKLILFDVGGVELVLNYSGLYEAGAKISGETLEQFKQKYLDSKVEPMVLAGEISHEQYLEGLKELLGDKSLTEGQLARIVRNSWGNQINEVVELKKKLAEAGYSVGIFSNMNKFALDILSKEFPEMFKTYGTGPEIYSYKVGAVKPSPKIYQAVPAGYEDITLIEDKASYVLAGINGFGWNGILFTPYIDSAEAIRAEKGHNDAVADPRIKIADSIEGLVSSLGEFGINF